MSDRLDNRGRTQRWSPPQQFDNYILEREIDGGGMGVIYKGHTINSHEPLAIKFLWEKSQFKRFQREANTGRRLRHPNFVRYQDSGEVDDHFYIVMDFIEGRPLKKYLQESNPNYDRRLELFHNIVTAVAYAHERGIIHRDLKPANILITTEGLPVILDFGLAKYIKVPESDEITALTIEGQILGTPGYMAPEQARGEVDQQDTRSDVFSLGIILYEILAGRNPFEGTNFLEVCYKIAHQEARPIEEVIPGIPPQLSVICSKALEKDKRSRYQTALEFAEDLHGYLELRKKRDLSTICYNSSTVVFPDTVALEKPYPEAFPEAPELVLNTEAPVADIGAEPEKKAFCFACGALNQEGAQHCAGCGSKLRRNKFSPGNAPPAIKNISAMAQPTPAKKVISYKGSPALPILPPTTGRTSDHRQLPRQSPKRKIPVVTPGAVDSNRAPILLTPDKEVSGKPLTRKGKNKFISGAIMMPLAMIPLANVLSFPWYGYIIDAVCGGIAQTTVTRRRGGGLWGVLIFILAGLCSFGSKWTLQWIRYPFSDEQWRHIIIAIVLTMLLGNIIGLASKKKRRNFN